MHLLALKNLGIKISEKCITSEFSDISNITSCGSLQNDHTTYKTVANTNSTAHISAVFTSMPSNASISLKFPSVGATENILLCFAFKNNIIELKNVAREPEIVSLQQFLNGLGANISGAGTSKILISPPTRGTDPAFSPFVFTTPPDRIEVGTFLLAGAMCGGVLMFTPEDLVNQNALIKVINPSIKAVKKGNYSAISFQKAACVTDLVITTPFPGFPTDLQSPLSAYFCTVYGKNYIIESIFNNRIAHLDELRKMGAQISKYKNCFTFYGRGQTLLEGALLKGKDLRGGMALILAGLSANGTTYVFDNSNITRGYSHIEKKLSSLGADISISACNI